MRALFCIHACTFLHARVHFLASGGMHKFMPQKVDHLCLTTHQLRENGYFYAATVITKRRRVTVAETVARL